MKVRKAIRAIAALGAGISMVGATIMGAMAANLSEYPAPFVQNGVFDGLIVVGDGAAAEDVVGSIDIGTSLQYSMRQEATFGTGVAAVTISEGKKIEKTGDKLNYGDDMKDVIEVLDDEDLPVVLADGRYQDSEGETTNDEKHAQSIRLYDGTGTLLFTTDDDGEEKADHYLFFDDGSALYAYNYTLEFDNAVEYTKTSTDTPAEDLEDTVLKIQGNDYTITDAKYDTTFTVNKLTLLAGETIIWLQQGKTLTRTVGGVEHEIEVSDVNDDEDMCGVSVDGDVVWIKKGQTQTINGVSVGVTDAVAVHAQLQDVDICKINVGATEVVIEGGKEVQVNGVDVDGTNGYLGNSSEGLTEIGITWIPDDEEYLADGASLADPVFGNFEFKFAGVSKVTETIELTASSDEAEFQFLNNDGKEVSIPFYLNDTSKEIELGNDLDAANCDGRLLLDGDWCDSSGTDKGAIEGVMFLLVTSGKEAHVMQISNIGTDNKTDIKDVTYSKTYNDKDVTGSGVVSSISLGSLGTINLTFDFTKGLFNATDVNLETNGVIETKNGANLSIVTTWNNTLAGVGNQSNGTIFFGEEIDETNNLVWNLSLYYYPTDDEIRISAPGLLQQGATGQWNKTALSESDSNKDNKYYVTEWGTLALYDSDDDDDITIWYPDEQVYGNAFIAPVGAVVSGAGGETSAVTLNPINVGSAKLASEVRGQETAQNLIAVGGPCVNEAAAVVMGLTFPACGADSTIPENKAIVKLFDNGGNVAMVVAGWSAADTRRATTVVAKYSDYADKLAGTEVEVSGTSMSDITVMAPSS